MLEKFARESYRYYQEAKVYIIFTLSLFGVSVLYSKYGSWGDGQGLESIMLFMRVFGDIFLFGFCLCVFFVCFMYAFHPELNGKQEGNARKLLIIRWACIVFSLADSFLICKLLNIC